MDVYHQVKHGLQAPHKVKKVISHWFPCGAHRAHKVMWLPEISRMHGQPINQPIQTHVCTSNEATSVIFVSGNMEFCTKLIFSPCCQQKVGSYGFITWNWIMCNNNVIVIMKVLFICLLPLIMWYIFTYLYLFDCVKFSKMAIIKKRIPRKELQWPV